CGSFSVLSRSTGTHEPEKSGSKLIGGTVSFFTSSLYRLVSVQMISGSIAVNSETVSSSDSIALVHAYCWLRQTTTIAHPQTTRTNARQLEMLLQNQRCGDSKSARKKVIAYWLMPPTSNCVMFTRSPILCSVVNKVPIVSTPLAAPSTCKTQRTFRRTLKSKQP